MNNHSYRFIDCGWKVTLTRTTELHLALMRNEEGYQRRLSLENLGDHYIVLI